MALVTLSGGKIFEVDANETILQGALRAGITIQYSCESGRCGTCKGRLLGGSTVAVAGELGLSDAEREGGEILVCARRADSDIEIDIADLGNICIPQRKILACRIDSLDILNPTVVKAVLRLPPGSNFSFLPGQYIDVISKTGIRRSYSIANAPRPDGKIELHIRRVTGGEMSRYWFEEAKAGDLLRLHGPLGTFFLRDTAGRDLILLATGTGLAPIKAMLEGVALSDTIEMPRSIRIFWGGRTPSDFYWDSSDLSLEMEYTPVLSRAHPAWQGQRGYVQHVVLESALALDRADVYACGSPNMIDGARMALANAGLDVRRFFSDAFLPSAKAS